MMDTDNDLRREAARIDGRGYKAYKDLVGAYRFPGFDLYIDHVQGDPFAAPSRIRARMAEEHAGYPRSLQSPRVRATGVENLLAHRFAEEARQRSTRMGTGGGGQLSIASPGQEVLRRSSMTLEWGTVEVRFCVGLPARGRSVLGRQAARLLCDIIPALIEDTLPCSRHAPAELEQWADTAEDAEALRSRLPELGIVAFIAEGAILPRRSGIDDRARVEEPVVEFQVPESLALEVELPNRGRVRGMGIPGGITLIVGGGFHGKSSLLNALERGVYNHIPGDGRELVVTDPTALKCRSEDGRFIHGVDISPFIDRLPYGKDTHTFSTSNASGSTSQAANILEGLESGARLLLMDEDTCATNFMIRDERMQRLVARELEPITPFLDKARQLYEERVVSSILVFGGSGDYFEVADTIIIMESYVPRDVTSEAKRIASEVPSGRCSEGSAEFASRRAPRIPDGRSLDPSKGKRPVRVRCHGRSSIEFGRSEIDLYAVEQLVDQGQTRAVGDALVLIRQRYADGRRTVSEILEALFDDISSEGLDLLSSWPHGGYAAFRRQELAAALNRLPGLRIVDRS